MFKGSPQTNLLNLREELGKLRWKGKNLAFAERRHVTFQGRRQWNFK